MSKLTRTQAKTVLAAVVALWPQDAADSLSGPNLRDHHHEELRPGCWSIDWDGGPQDWPHLFSESYYDRPKRVAFVEPINTCILAVYPLED